MPRDYRARKLTGRHRFYDVSHMKLLDIFKSLRRRRLHRDPSHRSSLARSRSVSRPFADYESSPNPSLSPNLSTSSSLQVLRHRSDVAEDDSSSGMSTSSEDAPLDAERGGYFSLDPFPAFPTSPSTFQLRSMSTRDYLVDRLEQHLSQLSLGDASTDHVALPQNASRDVPIHVSLKRSVGSPGPLPQRTISQNENVVPMILITSVDAKHAKPLPPSASARRSSRTPFGPSNFTQKSTKATSKRELPPDDPFVMLPHGIVNAYPLDYNLTFRLPDFPSAYSSPAPETPTPMSCDHFGDCRGDLWEILHPPLVAGRFTLPPFKLPPLSGDLANDVTRP